MTAPIGSSTTTPTSSTTDPLAGLAGAGGAMGKDQFIQLLVAQLTHQDPMNPADSSQMASQLAQFSSVEQLMNINSQLTAQASSGAAMTSAVNNNSALNLIGKTVMVQDPQIAVGGTNATMNVSADIPSSGGTLTLTVKDQNGNTVRTQNIGAVTGGRQTYSLAGITTGLPAGNYTASFALTDGNGTVTNPATITSLRVDGVSYGTNGASITSGGRTISIGSVMQVFGTN
ncbi:MAG: hypothetical protein HYR75_08290 [Gemmatimonadetes bacterium]|nr:hypothetical protein [Gemmatimonadota bacterium]MBI3568657.1 hypothetical protein [Gemmatimonadota bacterium]